MKYKEIKIKPKAELERMIKENTETLRDLRFKIANRKLKNISQVSKVKKEIARAKTALKGKS